MNRVRVAPLLVALLLPLTGCLTHVPMTSRTHLRIDWRANFAEAKEAAAEEGKPLLVVLVAGPIDGAC